MVATTADAGGRLSGMRLVVGYVALAAFLVVAMSISTSIGSGEDPAPSIGGIYESDSAACFGSSFTLTQSGQFVDVDGAEAASAKLRFQDGRLTGDAVCADGTSGSADLASVGSGTDARLTGTVAGKPFAAAYDEALPEPGATAAPAKKRSSEETFARLMLAIAAVILAARLVGIAIGRLGQPRVMGEVLAGILLGPTLLGAVAPGLEQYLFPGDIVPLLAAAASIGLAFYLFIVGMELDPRILRDRIGEAAFISNTSVAFPLALGFLAALPVYRVLATDADYLPFALFMGVAMSVTAFPVLARILVERRMLKGTVGALAMASSAIDDVTAWGLLALATAVAGSGSGLKALVVVGAAALFTLAIIVLGRPLLGRVSIAYDEVGRVPALWLGVIFVSVLLAAYGAGAIGIAPIFGAFVVGMVMPRHAGLTDDVRGRMEDFVVIVLLPLFFVVTGLRTEINALNRWELWAITAGLIVVAIVGKWLGAMLAARYVGLGWRESSVIGALMNTRGLTELIVLNIGLTEGLISRQLFTMLVVMALVTTFMTGPALKVLDPHEQYSAPPERDLQAVVREPRPGEPTAECMHSVIVAPQDPKHLEALLALAVPLSQSQPPRELLIARLLLPRRYAAGVRGDERALRQASEELRVRREILAANGIEARVAAFTTPEPGLDLVRLAAGELVDVLLLDGSRPLLGNGVPKGQVGRVLADAECDVAVLVERGGGIPKIDESHPVIVPFGGAEHDWAALEMGVWIASARHAHLRLLGASATATHVARDASRLLANTSLVVQQLTGLVAEPALVDEGSDVIRMAEGAGLLVVGLSDAWQDEGLGALRTELVKSAPAPMLLVRRGRRPGVLAANEDATRYRWSTMGSVPANA
jgi:Kef-type K+ transport system membrane component KefB